MCTDLCKNMNDNLFLPSTHEVGERKGGLLLMNGEIINDLFFQ